MLTKQDLAIEEIDLFSIFFFFFQWFDFNYMKINIDVKVICYSQEMNLSVPVSTIMSYHLKIRMKEYEYVSFELNSPFIIKVFASSKCRYCRLAWIFHSKSCNKTNYLHKRVLRKTYCDRSASFQDLLRKDNLVSIHLRN